jgi:hypothetical protein
MRPATELGNALRGSCLCGIVTYEIDLPFSKFAHCHCQRCRKATAHASNVYLAPGQLRWLTGRDDVARFDLPSARSFSRWFCRHCGSSVPRISRSGGTAVVPAGSLDDVPKATPTARIYCGSEAPWACRDGLPRFEEYPEWW